MKPFFENEHITLYHGNCIEVLKEIKKEVKGVITSPPYAMQRKKLYDGIEEEDYPKFTLDWMNSIDLLDKGNVLINIRENISDGILSDYILKTRLFLRENAWKEIDELIWIKPDSMPVGNNKRPRRSWERVLWFSNHNQPIVYPKHNGNPSKRIGLPKEQTGKNTEQWGVGYSEGFSDGVSRCKDYVEVTIGTNAKTNHPASYPVKLAEWMIKLISLPGELVLDPFIGSGSSAIAALNINRKIIGIDSKKEYLDFCVERIEKHMKTQDSTSNLEDFLE